MPSPVGVRDAELAARLAHDGFVRVGVALSADEVRRAREIFEEAARRLDRPMGDSWFPTILLPDEDVRSFIAAGLEELIAPRLASVLDPDQIQLLQLHFSVKPPSAASELGPHQDFSVVDERRVTSLYVWIALEDMDEHNGTLHVVPGSHRFANSIRSQHVPATFDEVLPAVHDAAVRLDCAAGEMVLMVSGVIHFSPPNRSEQVRLAAHGILTPVGEPMVFYYADEATPPGKVECYEMDLATYVRQVQLGRPGAEFPLSELQDRPPEMTPERFARGVAATRGAGS